MDKTKIPRHPRMGNYLVAHYGIFAEDDNDGLGPGWTSWDPVIHGSREEVEAAVTAWAASYVPPPTREEAKAASLAALATAKDALDKASTVAGVRAAAAAAIAALEARVAALEGK